jgi:hypothetical protein
MTKVSEMTMIGGTTRVASARVRAARRVAIACRFGSSGTIFPLAAGTTVGGSAFTSGMFIAKFSRSAAWQLRVSRLRRA